MKAITDLVPHLDPEVGEMLARMPIPDNEKNIEDFARWRSRFEVEATEPPEGIETEDLRIPGIEGNPEVSIRVYRPENASKDVIFYIHGGGFVRGDLNSTDPVCLLLVQLGINVVSVDYRLSPESQYPDAFNDCYAALKWINEGPDELGGKPERIVVGGGSAGGCLAAAVTLKARDDGGPKIFHQLLMVPVLDDRHATHSSQIIQDPRVWDRQKSITCWGYYLGEPRPDPIPVYASPARATDLSDLPPTTIFAKEMDLLRDEAVEYANRLTQAGVSTSLTVYAGTCHVGEPPGSKIGRRTLQDFRSAIRRIFELD